MKKILLLISLCFLIVSCSEKDVTNEAGGDNRIFTCMTIAEETKKRLDEANTNPDISLEFLETETILGDVSSCFIKVKISNKNDTTQPESYALFDVVREKTRATFGTLDELDAEVQKIIEETETNTTK